MHRAGVSSAGLTCLPSLQKNRNCAADYYSLLLQFASMIRFIGMRFGLSDSAAIRFFSTQYCPRNSCILVGNRHCGNIPVTSPG